jgi:hypothetical protein
MLKFVVSELSVAGNRDWIAAPTSPYITAQAYKPPTDETAIQQKERVAVAITTGIMAFRGPK